MRRYFWIRNSAVYHDRTIAGEKCNADDAKRENRSESDVAPKGRTLCQHCLRQGEWEARINGGESVNDH